MVGAWCWFWFVRFALTMRLLFDERVSEMPSNAVKVFPAYLTCYKRERFHFFAVCVGVCLTNYAPVRRRFSASSAP